MDITMCTSDNCNYKDECFRQTYKNLNNTEDILYTYCNFEYECCESDGFSHFIPKIFTES